MCTREKQAAVQQEPKVFFFGAATCCQNLVINKTRVNIPTENKATQEIK